MATFRDFIDALEEAMSPESSTKPEKSARKTGAITASASNLSRNVEPSQAGVMTDVGPANARAYSAILSGQQRSRQAESQTPVLAAPAGSLISSHIVDLANPVETPSQPPQSALPPEIEALSDSELRKLVNQLRGKKHGQKGSVGCHTGRAKLLAEAARSLGLAGKRPPIQRFASTTPATQAALPVTSEMAAPGPADIGYGSILAAAPSGAESQVATPEGFSRYPAIMAGAGEPPAPASISSLTPEAAPPLPPSLVSQVATGQSAAGTVRRQPSVTVSPPRATQRTVTAPFGGPASESSAVTTGFPTGSAGRGYPSILAGPPAPTGSRIVSASETSPAAVPPAPVIPEEPLRLTEALKRLTEAVTAANRHEGRTVARDIKGLSWQQRLERLQRLGKVLPDEEVQAATLKKSVHPRDVVLESERREQLERNKQQAGRRAAAKSAAQSLAQSVENSVGGVLSRIIGPRSGSAVGRTVGGMAGGVASRLAARGAAGGAGGAAGGAAAAGLGGAVGRLGALAVNPYVALGVAATAAAVALLKLPRSSQRLARSFLDSQRNLAKYSASMQGLFARMDYQERILAAQQAHATGGTTSLLGSQYMNLRSETQWSREAWTTGRNLAATTLVEVGRLVNAIIKANQYVKALNWTVKKINEALAQPKTPTVITDYLQGFRRDYEARARNRKPRRGRDEDKDD